MDRKATIVMICPCGSSLCYPECCGRWIDEGKVPSTPLELMRSRYTAFVQKNTDYLLRTTQGAARRHFHADETLQWMQQIEWLGLTIVDAPQPTLDRGVVEFIAHYRQGNQEQQLHERSLFRQKQGRWYYVGCVA